MNITVKKIIKELEKNYGWIDILQNDDKDWFIKEIIKDTLKVVDEKLIKHKNISIKKNEN